MLYPRSKARPSEEEKSVSCLTLLHRWYLFSDHVQIWRSRNHKKVAGIQDRLTASRRLVEDLDRQIGDEVELIVGHN